MTNSKPLLAGLFAVLLAGTPCAAATDDNSLVDPGFEQRLKPANGGWRMFEISMYSKNQARSGSWSMFNGGFSRSVPYHPYFVGNVSGAYQEIDANPGSRWRLVGYGLTPRPLEGGSSYGIIQLSFFDAEGNDLGTIETASGDTKALTSNRVDGKSPAGEWVRLDTGVATAPAGTKTVQAFTLYVDFSGADVTQGVYFDDLILCALDDADAPERCAQD